ncbi:MAG: hypothetical protein ACO225_14205 [Ilumatobacteraceae bacterium]
MFESHTDVVEFDQVAARDDRAWSWGRIVGPMALLVGVAVVGRIGTGGVEA